MQVRVDDAQHTYLRRPRSIHDVDYQNRTITLLVQRVGEGTNKMSDIEIGDTLNIIYPLGNGFTIPVGTRQATSVQVWQVGTRIATSLWTDSILECISFRR